MQEEVAAEQKEETETPEEEPEEESAEEGTLVDPQTGETVQMPDPATIDPNDDSVLGDVPINDNLLDVKPADAISDEEDSNPTE